MLCNSCLNLAKYPQQHKCVNCPRLCAYKEDKWCTYCSAMKKICSICGKTIQFVNKMASDKPRATSIQKIHPFFGGGCSKCGGG